MYAVSPDGQELAYTSNIDEVGATSTNNEIFLVPMGGGAPKKISTSPGSDSTPRYSPDGKSIAWLSQARGGYEAIGLTLVVFDRGVREDSDRDAGRWIAGSEVSSGRTIRKSVYLHRGRSWGVADLPVPGRRQATD